MGMKIIVDGRIIEPQPGQNLLAACLSAGLDVPYFCWHPALGSVGACRQCAVKIFRGPADDTGQIVMGCMTRLTPDMRVSISDAQATEFREAAIEMVLTNHPHDCPVCEVGGECHLQDMAVLTGHHARRYRFPKRTHLNQYLGPFIRHEMSRCIGCYRCVRFYQDYAGGDDFGVFGANRNIMFGRAADGALESDFAGNLVEVCPTGVFVDKPFSAKFRRKWDMRATPSVCPHCALGCNITLQERGGEFRRVLNRYNATLNGYFLCDRGRFGTGFLAAPNRLRVSRDRAGNNFTHAAAPARLAAVLQSKGLVGIGSARASLEANFALRRLVGPENFYSGVSDFEAPAVRAAVEIARGIRLATVQQAEQADAVLLLGDDPALVAPRLALALRQAARRVPAEVLAAREIPEWDANAARQAGGEARHPFIVAAARGRWMDRLDPIFVPDDPLTFATALADGLSGPVAQALLGAQRPLVVAGGDAALLYAAANLVLALRRAGVAAQLSLLLPEANSMGLALLDCRPRSEAIAAAAGCDVLVLERDIPAPSLFAQARSVTLLDHLPTPTVARADIAFAVGSFADGDGAFVNLEGRVQHFYKAMFGENDPPPAWALLRDAGLLAGQLAPGQWATHAALWADMAAEIPVLAGCAPAAPGTARPATLPHRHSGRTAADAQRDVREPLPPQHADSPLGTTMEGPPIHAQSGLAPVLWSPGWNSVQAVLKRPAAAPDGFIFADMPERTTPFPRIPPGPADDRILGTEEMSAYAPAIIARGA